MPFWYQIWILQDLKFNHLDLVSQVIVLIGVLWVTSILELYVLFSLDIGLPLRPDRDSLGKEKANEQRVANDSEPTINHIGISQSTFTPVNLLLVYVVIFFLTIVNIWFVLIFIFVRRIFFREVFLLSKFLAVILLFFLVVLRPFFHIKYR